MKAFFDHNIEPFIAWSIHRVVAPRGDEAVSKTDRFEPNTSDAEWLLCLGRERGWVIFTYDRRILRNPIERRAFYDSGLTAFFFRPAVQKLNAVQRTATVLWHWDQLSRLTELQSRGAYWLPLNKNARFEQIRV